MALFAAAITSVTTRAVEWGTGYDQLINDYLSAKDEYEKLVRWRAIMDNIRLYPRWHGSLLVTKGIADGVLLWSAATTIPKYLKNIGPKVMKSLKNCWSKFVEFLRKMCNSVYDIYNSSKSALKNTYAKMRKKLCQELSKLWETFYSNLCDTLANIKCETFWKWLQKKGVSIKKCPKTGKVKIVINNAMYTAAAGIGKVAYNELKKKNDKFEEKKNDEYIIVTAVKGATAAVTSGVLMVGSFACCTIYELLFGLMGWIVPLIYWIGGQIKTELYKYVCSIYGLIECYFGQIPQSVLEEKMREL
eukprot:467134_1